MTPTASEAGPPRASRAATWAWRRGLRAYVWFVPAVVWIVGVFFGAMSGVVAYSVQQFARGRIIPAIGLGSYLRFFGDPYYLDVWLTTLRLAAVATLIGLAVAYPVAYTLSRLRRPSVLIPAYLVLFSPMLLSAVVIAYGWLLLLSEAGLVSVALQALHLTDHPVRIIFTFGGVVVALVHALVPFMTFPILSVLRGIGGDLREAAQDLGANRFQTFWHVVVPLSMPGVVAACQISFALSVSAFAVPVLIGGGRVRALAPQIYADLTGLDLPLASVGSIVMLVTVLAILLVSTRLTRRYTEDWSRA